MIIDICQERATRAHIDLDAVATNVRALRGALPATAKLVAVVKANGYGHGANWVGRAALDAGAAMLGVATVGEGRALRTFGIVEPIVVLGSIEPGEVGAACALGLELTLGDDRLLDAVQREARRITNVPPIAVHLKVDTGLRRYGATTAEAPDLAKRITADPRLRFAGICTHFASADEPAEPFTALQWQRFCHMIDELAASGIPLPPRHVANSAAILTGQGTDCELARAGIALYGAQPSNDVPLLPGMRPAMRIESRIARIVPLAPGDTVGYNRTFTARRAMRGALVPLGYADGYRRSLSGRAWMGIAGRRASVLGRVSMDQVVVEVPDGVHAEPGDIVHVMGGEGAPSIPEMAALMETNVYEVLVGMRWRIPRIYERCGEIIAIDDAGAADLAH